ncbi:MAG: transcription-repair coupling factor [Bacilli bacterium]|nr:transcription-repair coupling factor [Bacilli bacterium]
MSLFNNILNELDGNFVYGLTPELKGLFLYKKFKKENKSIVCITSTIYEANKLYQILLNYTDKVSFFPMDDFLTSEALAISPEFKFTRLDTLNTLLEEKRIVITNLMGFLRFLPSPKDYKNSYSKVKLGDEIKIEELVSNLYRIGYKRESLVNKTGEIAVRGFIIDIFPINYKNPIRIEFWGDEIERISEFDIDTQISKDRLDEVIITPTTEFIIDKELEEKPKHRELINYIKPVSILDYLDNPIIFYDDRKSIEKNFELLTEEITDYKNNNELSNDTKFMFALEKNYKYEEIDFVSFDNKTNSNKNIKYQSFELDNFIGGMDSISKRLNGYIKEGKTVIVCLSDRYKVNRLESELVSSHLVITSINEIIDNKINLVVRKINSGYIIGSYVVVTEKELFNKKESGVAYKSNFKMGSKIRDINKLNIGDYVVHVVHGIGIYRGIKTLTKNGLKKDYLTIEYKGEDKLYIPVEKLEFINKYSSNEGAVPKVNKLGGTEWTKTKLHIKKKIESIAGDLLKLYSEREMAIGYAFDKDTEEQIEFEKGFEYIETKDQLKVTEEIKKDMEKSIPMDRLLCGDVGYGKTEVAFRAIFKAIMSNKQVLFLCPTTILSQQHFQNAIERFKEFPVRIELLNRFVTKRKQNEIIKDLSEGKVDLLIGTHRILSEDIVCKRLGLLVIDEEQRFGVKHKEKIKSYKNNIDVLTLSATPIPRTLQMSLAGVRSLSLIETPPVDRYPIQTYVLEENKNVIKDAIYKELAREGQVFILYNDIATMEEKKRSLEYLVPEARIICGHGKMKKEELEDVMYKFMNKEYDVLLCTTIIETGIDIPNVNTLIIIDADRYGLSQLYQIRGRVGRSNKIAYSYLMYNKGKILSDVAKKRLNVIKEFTELGSGFSIAMRDLSIRGAGDILGQEQSGFIDTVGVELFLDMLNEEVSKLKGINIEKDESAAQPLIEVETTIDDKYAKEEDLKIEIHQKINKIDSIESLNKTKEELEDRFGVLDENVIIYMYEELFEKEIRALKVKNVNQTKNFIAITLTKELTKNIDGELLFLDVISLTRKFRFSMKNEELTITLDTVGLDKHFIYYLIDMLDVLKKALKNT